MRSGAILVFLWAALAAACSSEAPSTPDGTGGAGGSNGVGGGPGGGGAGGACAGRRPRCVASCFTEAQPGETVCLENTWQCASGSSDAASCPAGSCATTPRADCCDPTTGVITTTSCGDGFRLGCPAGLTPTTTSTCLPPEVAPGVECISLFNQACSVEGHQCNSGGLPCTCQPIGDAGDAWFCEVI
jgi:hypothetical protein